MGWIILVHSFLNSFGLMTSKGAKVAEMILLITRRMDNTRRRIGVVITYY